MARSFISPCGACKHLRRKCTDECVFAPYFPPDNLRKFENVHKVFGASNVSKLLNELSATDRDDAVRSLVYEAEYRLKDPVYGCVSQISILHQRLRDMRSLLINAKQELASYIGPQAMLPILQPPDFMVQQQPLGTTPEHQAALAMEMIPEQLGPSGMLSQQQGPLGMVPQQQGLSGMIGQEHQVIMIPEEQHMGNPSTPMFADDNMAGLAMGAQARTSHESQWMIHEAQQSLQQQKELELQQRIFESHQLAAAISQREQLIMDYEQRKQKQLEIWKVNNMFKYNMGSGSGEEFNDMSTVAAANPGTYLQSEEQPPPDPHRQFCAQEAHQHHSSDPVHQFLPEKPEQHPSSDSYRMFLPQEPMALGTYDNDSYHFQPQQPEKQPPSDPDYQFFTQESEHHHSPELIHQFLPQQLEQHPPSDSCRMFLSQEPMALGTYDDNSYHFKPQQPELQPPSHPHHLFLSQEPEQHHSPESINKFLPQESEQHHFPDGYHQLLSQEPDIHPLRDSNFHFQPQQSEQHHHPDPDPYHKFLQQDQHPHPHDLQTQLFFKPLQSEPLQQIPQLQQPQQQQLLRSEDVDKCSEEDSNACPP